MLSLSDLSRRLRRALPVLVGLPLASLSVLAQDEAAPEPPAPEQLFQERIGVEVVSIDVVVTDKKGRPVAGLAQDDFELRIDGREVPIANFYAVTSPQLPEPLPEPLAPVEPAARAQAAPAPSAGEPFHLIVYLDSFYLTPISRKRVIQGLPDFLEQQIAAGARVMLATHDQAVRPLTLFTRNLETLRAALATAEKSPAVGVQQVTARRSALSNIQDIYRGCVESAQLEACADCFESMLQIARMNSRVALAERRAAIGALEGLVNALAVLEGRKALLHVSDGIQQQPGIDLFHYVGDQLCPGERQKVQEFYLRHDVYDLNDLIAHANSARVTFYTLEAGGVRNFSSASADMSGTVLGNTIFTPSADNDRVRFANLQGTLHFIAEETGGKALLNVNQFAPVLADLGDEVGTYYSLGYQPQHGGAGRTHRVGVKVPKKSHQVRYRRAFVHKKPDQQLADRTLGAVLFDVTENPLAAEIRPGAQTQGSEDRKIVSLEVSVPFEKLTLLSQNDTWQGRLTVVVAAPNEKGKRTVLRKKEIAVAVSVAEGEEPEGDYRFGVNVELAPGEYDLGVAIWDEVAAVGSFLSVEVEATVELVAGGD